MGSSAPTETRSRDAARSRAAILDAAETVFSERGFAAAGLAEIAATAGLARATPSYFFGNKEELYRAVLERVFSEREAATRRAFDPLVDWAEGRGGSLAEALADAADGYMEFLRQRPAFVRLIQREELDGGQRLRATRRESVAIREAFAAVRAAGPARGVRRFDIDDAVFLFVSLTFFALAQRATFMPSLRRDLDNRAVRAAHLRLTIDQLLHLIASRPGATQKGGGP